MPDVFYNIGNYEQASKPLTVVHAHEADIWPVADNSGSGTKDAIGDGLHPVVAICDRAVAADRAVAVTGVVLSFEAGLTVPTGHVQVNIAKGYVVRNYVANVLTYAGGNAATFEQTPAVGQVVYVDDSNDLGEGVTLSMSPLNDAGVANPVAGYLWYCQDEYADSGVGGPNATPTFDTALANSLVEQVYCVMLK